MIGGPIEVTIRGCSKCALARDFPGLAEWVAMNGPPGVRDHSVSVGNVFVERCG